MQVIKLLTKLNKKGNFGKVKLEFWKLAEYGVVSFLYFFLGGGGVGLRAIVKFVVNQ